MKIINNSFINIIETSKQYIISSSNMSLYCMKTELLLLQKKIFNNFTTNTLVILYLDGLVTGSNYCSMFMIKRDLVFNNIKSINISGSTGVYYDKLNYMYKQGNTSSIGYIDRYKGLILIKNISDFQNNFTISLNNYGYILLSVSNCCIYKDLLKKSTNPTWSIGINTYITTIGLYDLNNNLLAVGRLNKPIKREDNQVLLIKILI